MHFSWEIKKNEEILAGWQGNSLPSHSQVEALRKKKAHMGSRSKGRFLAIWKHLSWSQFSPLTHIGVFLKEVWRQSHFMYFTVESTVCQLRSKLHSAELFLLIVYRMVSQIWLFQFWCFTVIGNQNSKDSISFWFVCFMLPHTSITQKSTYNEVWVIRKI